MRGRLRTNKFLSAALAVSCLTVAMVGVTGKAGAAGLPPIPPTSGGTPACTFNGSSFPIITGVSNGDKIAVACTGLPALHPYLILQASLLIGIDPKAAALLSGGATPSPALLESALEALPEVDAASLTVQTSNLSGNLSFKYTVPTQQATDPNASCPPSELYFNAGILGCALAMVDLTTQKPVAAGSAVMEWLDYPLFPPNPSLNLSATKGLTAGQVLDVAQPGATVFWWVATLNSLAALLSGGAAPSPTITAQFTSKAHHHIVTPATQNVTITGASYNGKVLTVPDIEGSITVPDGLTGKQTASITYITELDGQQLGLSATEKVKM